jgi:hypothetical protein
MVNDVTVKQFNDVFLRETKSDVTFGGISEAILN